MPAAVVVCRFVVNFATISALVKFRNVEKSFVPYTRRTSEMTLETLICDSIRRDSNFIRISLLQYGVSAVSILRSFAFVQKCYNQKPSENF